MSLADRVCAHCDGPIVMMCALGTPFCCQSCRDRHREEWARRQANNATEIAARSTHLGAL